MSDQAANLCQDNEEDHMTSDFDQLTLADSNKSKPVISEEDACERIETILLAPDTRDEKIEKMKQIYCTTTNVPQPPHDVGSLLCSMIVDTREERSRQENKVKAIDMAMAKLELIIKDTEKVLTATSSSTISRPGISLPYRNGNLADSQGQEERHF